MKRFFTSRIGVVALCGFTLVMAVVFYRVAGQRSRRIETLAPVTLPASASGKLAAPNASIPGPVAATPAPEPLGADLAYLDRYQDLATRSRVDRDRNGNKVTRRRTAGSKDAKSASGTDSAVPPSSGALRLQGRAVAQKSAPAQVADAAPLPEAPAPQRQEQPREDQVASFRFAPYGRPVKCELVFTIDSTMEETPIVALVVEPVHNNGRLVIPAGTELHGMARPDRLRDRIYSSQDWVLVLPREGALPNGRELRVKGLALDRAEPEASGLTWGITDGSNGLQGTVIRSMQMEEVKRFAATFLSAAALAMEERQPGPRGTMQTLNTPRNAALQGLGSSLEDLSRKIADEVARHGSFIRVAAGKQFYFYPLQSIAPSRAALPKIN